MVTAGPGFFPFFELNHLRYKEIDEGEVAEYLGIKENELSELPDVKIYDAILSLKIKTEDSGKKPVSTFRNKEYDILAKNAGVFPAYACCLSLPFFGI